MKNNNIITGVVPEIIKKVDQAQDQGQVQVVSDYNKNFLLLNIIAKDKELQKVFEKILIRDNLYWASKSQCETSEKVFIDLINKGA